MVPHPRLPSPDPRLDDNEIETQRQPWNGTAIWRHATIQQAVGGSPHPHALSVIDGLLRQAEVAVGAPANLHDDEGARRSRVNAYEIQFEAADADVSGQDRPARGDQSVGDLRLRGVA
jgi:hypothetical protein